ncbi:transporter substrate-binding domain-containing protein [Pseudoflavonifractor phocaeensis]|uniref:transporter substrate-binding domain-containing protein n=1 Tax=Pseudoflavonifractor phocaeensis TaxID=1870988 RepID=UPI001957788F|nr:transporter substrate-binding domain-containing protein [Pseudoflavonifractor phocaeensis]MBM6870608.1 transporter substrate-binding domain-containing protein [Pseudoflavonifractor phocaeensis]
MKKRLISMALAVALGLSLTACSSGTATQPDGGEESTAPQTQTSTAPADSDAAESDLQYVKDKGTLVVGMTDFAPMDYKDENGGWIGFDADMAKAFAESLGVEVEFLEINWDNKLMELDTKGIDVIWNGMTITDEVTEGASVSEPYCKNGQVVVLPADKAEDYQTVESLSGLNFAVENGSAGAEQLDLLDLTYVAKTTQADALMEVASGASDACVIDLLMAGAMIGEGTSYPELTYTVQLNSEDYGVAFRQGSDLTEAFNSFWKDAYDAGTVMEVATTYGVQESIIEK